MSQKPRWTVYKIWSPVTKRGDLSAVPALRRVFDADPTLWQKVGDLAAQAQETWLVVIAGTDLSLKEAARCKLDEMREELASVSPTPIEKLLIERILACWLQVHQADAAYANALGSAQASVAILREFTRRQESSQRQYHASIKQLELVRNLMKPRLAVFNPDGKRSSESPRNRRQTEMGRFAQAR